MNTLRILIPLLGGLALTTPCVADPASLLAPDNPSLSSGWQAPASPTAGLKSFAPAEPKDWLQLNRNVTPKGASMGGMSGMSDMNGMNGMNGMNAKPKGTDPSPGGGSIKTMPGMSGMPGMGTMR